MPGDLAILNAEGDRNLVVSQASCSMGDTEPIQSLFFPITVLNLLVFIIRPYF